ncbi:phosphatidylinositol kinase [Chloropicon primus]|nr:phosphatidylinositol kinase [Chloropicon primus]
MEPIEEEIPTEFVPKDVSPRASVLTSSQTPESQTDLLLRLFDSNFFDEWMAVSYLFKHSGTGIEDYICNRLYDFPDRKLEKYLPQICIILASRGTSSLERFFNDLCSRSLNVAVKGYWLLTSFIDDYQKNESQQKHIKRLVNECCDAALTGHWVLPFRGHLETTHQQAKLAQAAAAEEEKPSAVDSPAARKLGFHEGKEDDESGESDRDSDSEDLTEGNENESARPSSVPALPLQDCERRSSNASGGVFSPLTSPRMRKNTFAATLDLFEALCEVSARLAAMPSDERQDALVSMLHEINRALESPEAAGSACIFPMCTKSERVVRLAVHDAILMNSREKVPFMIPLEVIAEEEATSTSTRTSPYTTPMKINQRSNGEGHFGRKDSYNYTSPSDRPYNHASPGADAGADTVLHGSQTTTMKADQDEDSDDSAKLLEEIALGFDSQIMDPLSNADAARSVSEAIDEAMTSICGEPPIVSVSLHVQEKKLLDRSWFGFGKKSPTEQVVKVKIGVVGTDLSFKHLSNKKSLRKSRRVPSYEALKTMAEKHRKQSAPAHNNLSADDPPSVAIKKAAGTYFDVKALFGESFAQQKARLRGDSVFGSQPGWNVRSVIVKAGDDCRQELMAVQLLKEFHSIFVQDGLQAWLRPIKVLVTSSHSALIETVVDAQSIHSIKGKLPKGFSLADFFDEKYKKGSRAHTVAKRNFVESMAGYSIVSYLLQIKDRHNANILLDEAGHLVHIDFGFMLSNSPGGINFETAPFKLTREFLEVMDSDADGKGSELFDYFKILCIQVFLSCRKHAQHFLDLVEMMQHSAFPCFSGGPRVLNALKKRFHLSATEEECIEIVLNMISDSMDAWRTRQYDYYQRVLNGIL